MQNTVIGSKRPVGATCPGGSFGASLATPASAPPNAKHTPKAKQTATILATVFIAAPFPRSLIIRHYRYLGSIWTWKVYAASGIQLLHGGLIQKSLVHRAIQLWFVMSGAAVYSLWREFDHRNDSRHTSVLVLVGNRHRRRPGIASLRIDVSGPVVLDLQRAPQRLGQWSPAPLPQSGNANGSIWRLYPVSLRVRAHTLLRSAGLHHQLPESYAPGQHSRCPISPCEELWPAANPQL